MFKGKASSLGPFFLFIAIICFTSYRLTRDQTSQLIVYYTFLFGVYAWVVQKEKEIKFWLIGSIIIRFSLLFVLPNLSDDFYRFIWDGRLWAAGQHPFAALPSDFLTKNIPGLDAALFQKLNSKDYFTIYPPVAQFIFWLGVKISPNAVLGSVVVMRILILLAETGSILLITKLLYRFELPSKNALVYALNPLVILELTGNLHFEAFVIFFLLLGIWLLSSEMMVQSAISFALAIGTKLLPVIFLPLTLAVLGWRKGFVFCGVVGLGCLFLFVPLYDQQAFEGFSQSVNLYFQKFEFNASLYYLVREYGFWKVGYNIIQTAGWKLGVVSGMLIVFYSIYQRMIPGRSMDGLVEDRKRNIAILELLKGMLFALLIYFSFSTIVHPWYITTLLAFSVFTRFRFPVVWSALIFLTYAGYSHVGFSENLLIIVFEYVVVFGYLGYELIWEKRMLPST